MSLVAALGQSLQRWGDAPAITEDSRTANRKELLAYGAGVARRLLSLDCGDCGHIGILLPNGIAMAAAVYGCFLAGKVAAPMNPLVPVDELRQLCTTGDIRVIIAGGPLLEKARAVPGAAVLDVATLLPGPEDVAALPTLLSRGADLDPESTAVIIFTSGTTGASKATMLSHRNLASNLDAVGKALHMDEGEKMLGVLPFFHSYGMTAGLLLTGLRGLNLVTMPRFMPQGVLKTILENRIGYVTLVPAMYAVLLQAVKKAEADLRFVKAFISGGSALPPALADAWEKTVGVPILEGYGQTEASPVISNNAPGANKPGTVGKVLPGVEAQIWDDEGRALPQGEIGEIVVRGPNVMKGYYKAPEATEKTITREGWLKTGDFGTLDAEGNLAITGRKKELIIVAGDNVYPQEVENAIGEVPGVVESAVVAGHDDLRGEFVRAFVVPARPDPESELSAAEKKALADRIVAHCRVRLSPHKVPRTVEFARELPRNTLGKVLKRELEKYPPAS